MRVLIGVQRLHKGGGPIAAVATANAIAEQGIPVLLVGADGPSRIRLAPDVDYAPIPRVTKASLPRAVWSVARTIRKFQPTVMHVHGAAFAVVTRAAAVASRRSVPQIMTHHSAFLLSVPPKLFPAGAFFVRNSSDHLISIATWKQPYLEKIARGKVPVTYLPNFIDASGIRERMTTVDKAKTRERLGIPVGAMVVTFIARLVPLKGVETFVQAMARYGETGRPQAVGLVVGDGPLGSEARELSARLGAPVRFTGYQQDITEYLAITDVAVFPSERETLPTVVLEAGAAGLPVVCSDIAGHREIIVDGENGLLVDHPDRYPQFIKRVLEDSEEAQRLGDTGRALILEKYDKPKVVPQLLELYRSVEEASGKRR